MEAQELAVRLHVSAMAVRQHLYALHAEQLVTYHETPRPRGRPAKRWQLTPAADRLFPEAYAELTLSLLTSITETFGKPGLERLLALRSRQQVAAYRAQMRGHDALPQRLAALAAGKQNRFFQCAQLLYSNQGAEGSDWLNDDMVRAAYASIPGFNSRAALALRGTSAISSEVRGARPLTTNVSTEPLTGSMPAIPVG